MATSSPWAYQKGVLWSLELLTNELEENDRPQPVRLRLAATFEEVSAGSAESIFADLDTPNSEQFSHRLTLGRRCFVGQVDGSLTAYGWVSTEAECIGELEREISPGPGEAYVWDCVTLPAYRRQGLYSALLSHINSTLAREGCRRVWIGSNLENRPSLRGFTNAGYRPVVSLTLLRLARLNCIWISRHRDAPGHLATAARDAFSLASDRKVGALIVGRSDPAKLAACAELEA